MHRERLHVQHKSYCGKRTQKGGRALFNVVFALMEGLLNSGRTLMTDNFYTSVTLASELLKRESCGKEQAQKRQNCCTRVQWHCYAQIAGYKSVLMVTTKHTSETTTVGHKRKDVAKPGCLLIFPFK